MQCISIVRSSRLILILLLLTSIFSGCSGVINSFEKSNFLKFQRKYIPGYLDFCDILIPSQLKVDKKKTCIFRTSRFSVGVLSLRGKIETDIIISFFKKNMSDDNWNIVNSFKSKRSLLLFEKDSRWCTICIDEGKRLTYVEIWVLPDKAVYNEIDN